MRNALSLETVNQIYNRAARRYDRQHGFLTAGSDQRGRMMVVAQTVSPGDTVLDCGAGTGSTALLAAQRAGDTGSVTLFDLSANMLAIARQRAETAGLAARITVQTGDMLRLPFDDNSFDAVLSTYSICPLYDPAQGALELYRVVKPGGRIGVAHSTEPQRRWVKWLADAVEAVVWKIPALSLGCRAVSVLPALTAASVGLSPAPPEIAITTVSTRGWPAISSSGRSSCLTPVRRASAGPLRSPQYTNSGFHSPICSSTSATSFPAARATMRNRPGEARTTSSVCRPIEPVEPSTANLFTWLTIASISYNKYRIEAIGAKAEIYGPTPFIPSRPGG